MKIVRMSGQLGNQMVKYSVYLSLKKRFPEEKIVIDDRIYDIDTYSGPLKLSSFFGLSYDRYDDCVTDDERAKRDKEIVMLKSLHDENKASYLYYEYIAKEMKHKGFKLYRQYGDINGMKTARQRERENRIQSISKLNAIQRIKQTKLYRIMRDKYQKTIDYSKEDSIFVDESLCRDQSYIDRILIPKEDAYYYCHWEQYDYWFRNALDQVVDTFVFPKFEDARNTDLASKITCRNSISIHIRRTDGLFANHILFEDDYYRKAVKYLRDRVEAPVFVVFSSDVEWCKKNSELIGLSQKDEVEYVDWNVDEDYERSKSHNDMHLMSICKHNIIANSTFSFMGGLLNKNPQKIVCCPKDYATKGFVQIT